MIDYVTPPTPEEEREVMGEEYDRVKLSSLVGKIVLRVTTARDGTVVLRFTDGSELLISHDHFFDHNGMLLELDQ